MNRLRESPWCAVSLKAGGVVVALLLLGWIGGAAAAAPDTAPRADSASPVTVSASLGVDAAEALNTTDGGATPGFPTSPSLAASASVASTAPPTTGRATTEAPVYLNQASVDELRRLPGVGAKRADAILALRQRLGRFRRVEDLLRVKGVGRNAVKKWRPLVRLDPPDAPDGGAM